MNDVTDSVTTQLLAETSEVIYDKAMRDVALFDAAHVGWRFPVKHLRRDASEEALTGFSFYGPTCDDMDHMAGPFSRPGDIMAGDYIELGMFGAYGCAMRTGFNGFGSEWRVVVEDEPMASLYRAAAPEKRSNVVKL